MTSYSVFLMTGIQYNKKPKPRMKWGFGHT